ncbi:WD40 repeat-like protein [Paxillus ammoniavirescens]|nr:WD40 repeat-like protein [Paxillus ammoniavirescens]
MSNTSEKSVDLTAKPLTTISGHEGNIRRIEYLPGGTRIVTCSFDKTVRLWDVEYGKQEGTSIKHEDRLLGLAVTKDGKRILSGGRDNRIRVWDVETHELIQEWGSHENLISCIAMSPDDRLAASGGEKGEIVIREIEKGGRIRHLIDAGSGVPSLCFSPNGEKLACAVGNFLDEPGVIHVYDVESGELVLGPIKVHENSIRCVLWSLDGSQLFSASYDHTIRCWDSDTGESIGKPWKGHTHYVNSLSLSPDGTKLASASWDKTVRFWDARSGDPIAQLLQHDDFINVVTFSPSGEFVASGGNDKKVSIWRVPWWDDSQKQPHHPFLDLPAVPVPKDRHQGEYDFLDLPTTRTHRPIASSFRSPADSITVPIGARVQRFWRALAARRSSSSPQQAIEPQPIRAQHFWKSPIRTPVTEIAAGHAKNGVVVGRSVPRRKKKNDKSRKAQKPRTHAGSSAAEAGVSSSNTAVSSSNAGPSNSQPGPSTFSNTALAGRTSSFVESTADSEDSWDDMDCCGKCLDYFCVGPRADRETFRPWKKKSRAVIEAEEQAKKRKKKGKARRRRSTKVPDSQNTVHPPHHLDLKHNGTNVVSPVSPTADEVDRQRIILHLQEQVEQLRRQLDESKQKADAERYLLEREVEELQSCGRGSDKQQGPHLPKDSPVAEAGPSPRQAVPSGSNMDAGASSHFAGSSTMSNGAPGGGPSSSTQSNFLPIDAEERAKKENLMENAPSHQTSEAAHSQNMLHAPHPHGSSSEKDNVTMASSASPTAHEVDVQRSIFLLQEQVEELRRRLDDPKPKAEEKEGPEKHTYSGQESDKPYPQMYTDLPTVGAGPSSRPDTSPSTFQVGPSTFSNNPPDGHPSSSTQSHSAAIQAEEQANEQRKTTLNDPTSHATYSQNDTQKDDINIGSSPAPTTTYEADLQRLILHLQAQNEQLRQQLDDSKRYLLEKEVEIEMKNLQWQWKGVEENVCEECPDVRFIAPTGNKAWHFYLGTMSKTSEKSVDLTAKPLTTISGHEDVIWGIEYLSGGTRIVTCSWDKTIRIWDVENGEQERTSMEHEGGLFGLAVTRDGKRMLSGGEDKRIKVWDVKTHELMEEWESHTHEIYCIAMSPDDQLAASGGNNGEILIREIEEGGRIKHAINAGGSTQGVHSVCFSPNGEKLACDVGNLIGHSGVIHVYDVESGELVLGPIEGHTEPVHCVLWSLDGSQLFSASLDHTIRCWNSDTGESIGDPWKGHTDGVNYLSLSSDGTKLASASQDETVRFWDAHSGDPIGRPLQHENSLRTITFSPSGEFVASGGSDNKVSIWRVPWWDDSQKQAHNSFLDLPAVPMPKARHQGEFDFLDLPTSRRPFISSSRPPVDSTPAPIATRIQRFWRGLVIRRPSSTSAQQGIELQPVQDRRFWKSPLRSPLTEVATAHAKNGVVVGRRERRRKKKRHHKSHKSQGSQAPTASSTVQAEQSGSGSNAGPSTSQAGPSNTSNATAAGRRSSFAPSNVGSEDSWDDMDCCGKCLDYFCVGPRADRETFRPWKKKTRAVLEAEKQAKEEKERAKAEKRRAERRRRRNRA